MSKAFTKEDDDAPVPETRKRGVAVPEPNYLTASGLAALRAEAAATTDPDRTRELADHLATAIVGPDPEPGRVGFGSAVTVEDDEGKRTTYRIVGAIEADPKRGAISWQSPIANELWECQVGDSVELPRGEVEIVAIE